MSPSQLDQQAAKARRFGFTESDPIYSSFFLGVDAEFIADAFARAASYEERGHIDRADFCRDLAVKRRKMMGHMLTGRGK